LPNMPGILFQLWLVPSVLLAVWTFLAAVVAWSFPLRSPVPLFAQQHVLLLMHNPKDEYLYRRPSFKLALLLMLLWFVPALNLVWLTVQVGYAGLVLRDQLQERRKTRVTE
jgi:hypothetical protein